MHFFTCLKSACAALRQHLRLWAMFSFVLVSIELAASLLLTRVFGSWGAVLGQLLVFPFWGCYVSLAALAISGQAPSIRAAQRALRARPLAFMGLALFTYGGLLVFGVGILATVAVGIFAPIFLLQGQPLVVAIRRSGALVLKQGGSTFWLLLSFVLLNLLGTFSCGVGLLLTLPLSALLLVVTYQQLDPGAPLPVAVGSVPLDPRSASQRALLRSTEARALGRSQPLARAQQRGATFVEYLLVIVVALLIAVGAMTAYQRAVTTANQAQGQAVLDLVAQGSAVDSNQPFTPDNYSAAAGPNSPALRLITAYTDDPFWLRLLKGFASAAWEDITGFVEYAQDLWNDPTGTLGDTWNDLKDLAQAFKEDPLGTTGAVLEALFWDEETQAAWARGDYATALGRTAWNVGSLAIPGAGVVSKIAKAAKVARKVGDGDGDTPTAPDSNRESGDRNSGSRESGDRTPHESHSPGHADRDAPNTREPDTECAAGRCTAPDSSCFVAGTLVATARGAKPIEQVTLGERVGPESATCAELSGMQFTQLQLQLRSLAPEAPKTVELHLLRPHWWVEQHRAKPGSELQLALDELGLVGTAQVLSVEPGPRFSAGKRCPVTALIRHTAARVITLTLAAGSGLTLTPEHRLFSASRGQWTAAGLLLPGEHLQSAQGPIQLTQVDHTAQPPTRVFNLEVWDQHQYFVGTAQVLAHNNYTDPPRGRVDVRPGGVVEGSGVERGRPAPDEPQLGDRDRTPAQTVDDRPMREARNDVRVGRGPEGITRIDRPDARYPGTQWEAHTGGRGSPALLLDGTWKDLNGGKPPRLPRKTLEWLRDRGWNVPL